MRHCNGNELDRAAELWRGGQPLEAWRLIFEKLPTEERSRWASRVLRLVIARSGVQNAQINHLLDIADNPKKWGKAHQAFSRLRKSTLALERLQARSHEQDLLLRHLYLAENVAKVICNSTTPLDRFDEDSGSLNSAPSGAVVYPAAPVGTIAA